jgi:hypothetical protein
VISIDLVKYEFDNSVSLLDVVRYELDTFKYELDNVVCELDNVLIEFIKD